MQYISIDIETTGLDHNKCQILQVGAIFGDTEKPELVMPDTGIEVNLFWPQESLYWEPIAKKINQGLLDKMILGYGYPQIDVIYMLRQYIIDKFPNNFQKIKFIAAGKNFAGFDNQFLLKAGFWDIAKPPIIQPLHRTLDVGSMYARANDVSPPDLKECCVRAGLPWDAAQAHTALYDATLVANLIQLHYQSQISKDLDWAKEILRRADSNEFIKMGEVEVNK